MKKNGGEDWLRSSPGLNKIATGICTVLRLYLRLVPSGEVRGFKTPPPRGGADARACNHCTKITGENGSSGNSGGNLQDLSA